MGLGFWLRGRSFVLPYLGTGLVEALSVGVAPKATATHHCYRHVKTTCSKDKWTRNG